MGLSAGSRRREGLMAASPRHGKDLPAATMGVYHQQTQNLLVSYSAQKLGFF
jgi:hypothetical protein